MPGLVITGGDCRASAPGAKPNEEQPKCKVRRPQHRGQRTLQPLQAVVALTEEGNLNLDVAGKTPLSDWRRIGR